MIKTKSLVAAALMAIFIVASIIAVFAIHARGEAAPPTVRAGLMDLASWDFESRGSVKLDGTWLFAKDLNQEPEWIEIGVPDTWNRAAAGRRPMEGPYGEGRYRIRILLPPQHAELALDIPDEAISYRLYVDGELRAENGILETEKAGQFIRRSTMVVPLDSTKASIDLTMTISNHQYDVGGIINPILIGPAGEVTVHQDLETLRDGFLIGALLVTALYHLTLFMLRRSDGSNLYFFGFCLLMAIRAICVSHYPEQISSGRFAFGLSTRTEYLAFFFGLFTYMQFIAKLFPGAMNRRIPPVFGVAAVVGASIVIITPVPVFMMLTTRAFQVAVLIGGVITVSALLRSLTEGRKESLIPLLGFAFFFIFLVNDILYSALIIHTAHLTAVGVLAFIASQSITVALRFNESYHHEMRLARELSEEHALLDARVIERTAELAEANRRLSELDKSRTIFFANASHELRTPVSLITAPLDAILAGRYGERLPRTAPVLSLMKRSADRLKCLADELLELLQLDSGAVTPRPVALDLSDFASSRMEEFLPLCERKGIAISFDPTKGTVACVDPDFLETAWFNLLSNAVRFTPPGGRIEVRTGVTDARAWIEVADTGTGIPTEKLPRLFDRYAAVGESSRSDYSGFGIGLPLAAGIVRRSGGEIEVRSEEGKGSTFRMSFPHVDEAPQESSKSSRRFAALVPVPEELPLSRESDESGSDRQSVLVVDDDRDMTAFLTAMLSRRFLPHPVHSAEEALIFLRSENRPRAIVADVMMPGMDGMEFRKSVASLNHCASIPFLFLSAKLDETTRLEGLEAGAVDFIGKPFNVDELEAKISALIEVADAERSRLEMRVVSALHNDSRADGAADWRLRAMEVGIVKRDIDIVDLILQGRSDKEIAAALGLSVRTISNRVSTILRKTGSVNRTALAAWLQKRAQ